MHRYFDKCVFFLNECALCRKDIDYSVTPQPDHFIQTLARDNVKELPLCGCGVALLFQDNKEHRQQCITCLQTLCLKQEESMRLLKNRCYHLLSNEMESDDSDDEGPGVLRLRVQR
jgi:hypothetical protein